MTVAQGHHNLVSVTRLSPPVDTTQPYDPSTLSGKTWASHGANIILGDVNPSAGEALVATLRAENPKGSHHFVACDVTSWDSQVAFFKEGARLSPDGAVDVVVANAGINDPAANHRFESPVPSATDPDAPTEPSNRIIDVNVTGLSYTAHLALFWLPRNGPSRDRCLVFVGSVAGVHHFMYIVNGSSRAHSRMGF
ncbi:AdhA protein, partial [Colletotrichum higginsianum]